LIDIFNEGFNKLNKTNNSKPQQSISSLKKLNSRGIKKKRIKKVLLSYLNPDNMAGPCMPRISSVKEFCENFVRVETLLEIYDDDD